MEALQMNDDDGSDAVPTQDISGGNINPAKLIALLRLKFGLGAYQVYVCRSFKNETVASMCVRWS